MIDLFCPGNWPAPLPIAPVVKRHLHVLDFRGSALDESVQS